MSGTLRLRGSTSGYSELQAPAVAADQTFVLPTTGGTLLTTDSPVPKLTLELGSASQPSLTFQGDTDTGLFSEGTNTLNLVTGGSSKVVLGAAAHTIYAGTGATVRAIDIDSSGNVGVGTSDPYEFSSVQAGLTLAGRSSSFATRAGALTFKSQNGTFLNSIDARDGNITIYRSTNSGSSTSSDITIDSSGNVGIGTTSPAEMLEVQDGSISIGSSTNTNSTNTLISGYGYILNGTKYGNTSIRSTYSNATNAASLEFYVASSSTSTDERMRIDSSGRVGIGTTSPSLGLLEVSSANGVTLAIKNTSPTLVGNEFCQLTFNSTSNSATNFESAKIKVISTNGGVNLAHLTFENSGTERARIDSSGRLLVGTSSARANFYNTSGPTAALQVEGTDNNTAAFSIVANTAANANAPQLIFGKSAGTAVGSNTLVAADVNLGRIAFQGNDGAEFVQAGEIRCDVDGTPGSNDMPGRLVFSTTADGASSPTERMRIGNAGIQRIFSSTTAGHVSQSSAAAGTSSSIYYGSYGATNNAGSGAINSFVVWNNGNVQNTNNSYTALSDIKLKENIVDAGSQWDDLKAFQVRKYNLKEGQTHTQIGLIAQEVELVSPGLVYESPDRDAEGNDLGTVTKSVNYSVLYMKAVKALQEAMERIETLEQRLSDAGIA